MRVATIAMVSLLTLNCCIQKGHQNKAVEQDRLVTILSNDLEEMYESLKGDFKSEEALIHYVNGTSFFKDLVLDSSKYHLLKANEFEPKNAIVLKDLGILFTYLKDINSAKMYLKECLEVDPDNWMAMNSYGYCLCAQDSCHLSLDLYNRAMLLSQNNSHIYLNKALAFQNLGLFDSSCVNFDLAVKYNEDPSITLAKDYKKMFNCD